MFDIESKPKGLVRRKLSREDWEELAYKVMAVINKHLERCLTGSAEKGVLEALDDVVEVDCEALEAARLGFVFHEHGYLEALCGYHWYTHALAACWDEIGALFAEKGRKLVGPRPDLSRVCGPQASYAFACVGDNILAVHPNGELILIAGKGEEEVLPFDSEALEAGTRKLARKLHETGLCRCSLCEAVRPAGIQGEPAAKRLPPEPDQPGWLSALKAAESGDLATLDGIMAGTEYVDIGRCFEEAVKSPGAETVKHLIALGHNPTAEAVANAARYDAVEALRVMRDAGADLEAYDGLGRSPLANAAMYGSVDALRLLLEAGVEVDALDEYHASTALLWAFCEENHAPGPIVEMLIAAGADIDVKDNKGRGIMEFLGFIEDEEKKAGFSRALGLNAAGLK